MNITPDLKRILDIAVSLTAEKKYSKLLEKLISECMEITNCDAGTLYILKDDKLEFMILRNNTMNVYKGGNGEPIDSMPPVILNEKYVCAYSAIKKTTINVKNVYDDSQFDWQGPRKYDSISGYHTESMLVVPLINHDDKVIGVLQLINAKDKAGNTIGFSEDNETIVFSISSEAAISLSNMILLKQLRDMLYSFVSSLTTAIDQRTPYNANHSYNVARYCDEFAKYIMRDERPRTDFEYITDSEREQLVMAALVHDVGKLITPIEIMNKPDRLDFRLPI
ncbi:MAG: GAF domain-containing protein, partial [Lachnospiraceae bacterium]|nr:GAF domain-containing protein [Lachnospiraceae bacterium]